MVNSSSNRNSNIFGLTSDILLRIGAPWFQLLEEVVALVINQDECREVFNVNLPHSLHTQFRIFYALDALDRALREDGSNTTNGTQIA